MPRSGFWFDSFLVAAWLPEAHSGEWSIRRHAVEGDRAVWLAMGNDPLGGTSPPAIYSALLEGERQWMTDEPSELLQCLAVVEAARGDVLITGLGLGLVSSLLCRRDNVRTITIVERQPAVIELVWPALSRLSAKLKLVADDAFQFRPDRRFDLVYHDIWLGNGGPPEIPGLFMRYRPFAARQAAWTRERIVWIVYGN